MADTVEPVVISSVPDRTVFVVHSNVQIRVRLEEKFQQLPFCDAVLAPFVKAYNKKAKQAKCKERLDKNSIERVEIDSCAVEDLTVAACDLLPRNDMRAVITAAAPQQPCKVPGWKPKVELAGPYARFLQAVGAHSVDEVVHSEELPWSNKYPKPEDLALFASMAKEHGPLRATGLYAHHCKLGDDGVEALAAAFEHMPQLRSVYLQANQITTRGIQALCRHPPPGALKQCR